MRYQNSDMLKFDQTTVQNFKWVSHCSNKNIFDPLVGKWKFNLKRWLKGFGSFALVNFDASKLKPYVPKSTTFEKDNKLQYWFRNENNQIFFRILVKKRKLASTFEYSKFGLILYYIIISFIRAIWTYFYFIVY